MRKRTLWAVCVVATFCVGLWAANWASTSGNPQRDGWSQGETMISKQAIAGGKFKLIYKFQFDNQPSGLQALTQPIDLSNIIGYEGFKELLFIGGSSNTVYSIDSDLGKLYFQTPLAQHSSTPDPAPTVLCPGGLTANVAMEGNSGVRLRFAPPPARGRGTAARGGAASRGARGRAAAPARRGPFVRPPAVFWAVGSDGYLETLRQQDGNATWISPVAFVPAHSRLSGLNVNDNIIYGATIDSCGGNDNGLYAASFTPPVTAFMPNEPLIKKASFQVNAFMTNGSGFAGDGGTAIGTDGTVYGEVADGHGAVAGVYHDTVLALDPKTLTIKDWFTPEVALPAVRRGIETPGATPAFFSWNGKDMLVAADRAGHIYLLDAAKLGGAGHHTPLYRSAPVVHPGAVGSGNGIWGAFSTWEDSATHTRWIYASIRGPAAMKFPASSGPASGDAVVAFKLESRAGHPVLVPAWIARGMAAPAAPATANGIVFALSTGLPSRGAQPGGRPYTVAQVEHAAKPAVLFVLDGATGQRLYSGDAATTFASSGPAVANGRVYFSTHDSTLYTYGVPLPRS